MAELVRHDLPPTTAPVILYQTAAGPAYEVMLKTTASLHRAFAAANGLEYVVELGVRRGHHPWQASFNRIEMLGDLLAQGFAGWFAYLDADAVIQQPGFGLRRYLGKREGAALVAAPGGPEWWNINNGVFFLNLGHPLGREIAARWHAATHAVIGDALLRSAAAPWQAMPDGSPFPDDQHLLQMELLRAPKFGPVLLREESGLINHGTGRFIRQYMRTSGSDADRLDQIRAAVASARP